MEAEIPQGSFSNQHNTGEGCLLIYPKKTNDNSSSYAQLINLADMNAEDTLSSSDTDSETDKSPENQLIPMATEGRLGKRPLDSNQNFDPSTTANQRKAIRIVGSRSCVSIKYESHDASSSCEDSSSSQTSSSSESRKYKCNCCSKSFQKLSNLTHHELVHSGMKPYSCCECGKNFSRPCTLMVHMRSHTGERPFNCSKCGKTFTTSCKLQVHGRTHSGLKPYICPEPACQRKFTESSALISHRRKHSGERPYKCHDCDKTFAHTSSLVKHFGTHIKKKQKNCNLCFEKCADQNEFDLHRQKSGEWKCDECSKVFLSKCSLGQHYQKHLRDKFKCERCPEKFTSASSLSLHMKRHSLTWGDFAF